MLVADISFGDLFWSMLWFFFLFLWIMILVHIFSDLIRDRELSGWGKAAWVLFILFLPFLAVFIYLIARGPSMTERSLQAQQQAEQQFAQYVQNVGGGGNAADQIAQAKTLLDQGAISQAEYDALKAKALA